MMEKSKSQLRKKPHVVLTQQQAFVSTCHRQRAKRTAYKCLINSCLERTAKKGRKKEKIKGCSGRKTNTR